MMNCQRDLLATCRKVKCLEDIHMAIIGFGTAFTLVIVNSVDIVVNVKTYLMINKHTEPHIEITVSSLLIFVFISLLYL